ncbi:uncharacterized protein LOC124157393 [Ischnura elegans]|uniref:uncharacterized protein LOC124157393 n=1 Tax=Ischnura elegans TaxID=197161 RepID=UPI001ED86EDC|nr:uncharacterized protein LOC124157393 [Ischnura elegans]
MGALQKTGRNTDSGAVTKTGTQPPRWERMRSRKANHRFKPSLLLTLTFAALFHKGAVGAASGSGLKLLELRVPEKAELGESATLECKFELGGDEDNLYSVKWYKDDHEFFRYTPDDMPHIQLFPVAGVNLDESESGLSSVTLRDLTFESSGSYRCEVSTEAPDFKTVLKNRFMAVWAPPRADPAVEGLRPSYSVGDLVAGNCTSASSFPPANLTWFLNGRQLDRFSVEFFSPWPDGAGLQTARLGLRFRADTEHFRDARPAAASPSHAARELELRCVATVQEVSRQRSVRALLLAPPSLADQRPAKIEGGRGAATCTAYPGYSMWAIVIIALLLSPELLAYRGQHLLREQQIHT